MTPSLDVRRPERRESTAQEPEFLSQDTAGVTFESIGDLRDRKRWITLKKQVNLIGHDFHRVNCQGNLISLFEQQRAQTLGNSIRENLKKAVPSPFNLWIGNYNCRRTDSANCRLEKVRHGHPQTPLLLRDFVLVQPSGTRFPGWQINRSVVWSLDEIDRAAGQSLSDLCTVR